MSPFFTAPGNQSEPGTSVYELLFFDSSAVFLSSHTIELYLIQDVIDAMGNMIYEAVPVPTDWATMELFNGQDTLQTFTRSANLPEVELIEPQNDFQWPAQGTQTTTQTRTSPARTSAG